MQPQSRIENAAVGIVWAWKWTLFWRRGRGFSVRKYWEKKLSILHWIFTTLLNKWYLFPHNNVLPFCRHKLELAYRLCPRCERYLKRKLNNVKKNILGSKLAQLGAKGLRAFESHFSTDKMAVQIQQRRQLFTRVCLFSLIVISTIIAYQTTATIDINKNKLDAVFNPSTTAVILIVASYSSACNILIKKFVNYFISMPYITAVLSLCQMVMAYLHSSFGQTAWDNVLTELSLLSNDINATDKDEVVIANVAGCLLSIFAIFVTGFNFKSAFSLILWSVNSLLATQINRSAAPLLAVIIDAISVSFIIILQELFTFISFRFETVNISIFKSNSLLFFNWCTENFSFSLRGHWQ